MAKTIITFGKREEEIESLSSSVRNTLFKNSRELNGLLSQAAFKFVIKRGAYQKSLYV